MKKMILCLVASLLTLTFIPGELNATSDSHKMELKNDTVSRKVLLEKLNAIKANEPSMINGNEKFSRKEIRGIEKALEPYDGIYISVGALIIIILLLIIFF